MIRFVFTAFLSMLLVGCGVGTYSVQSGIEDAAYLTFTDDVSQDIVVLVDNTEYKVQTVKYKSYKSGRNIKQTSINQIKLKPGQHNVTVLCNGESVFNKKLYLSTSETKIIEL